MRRLVIGGAILVLGLGAGLAAGFYYFGNDKPTYIRSTAPADQLVTYIGNCTAKELTLSYGEDTPETITGTTDITVYLNNTSRTSRCDINGFPTVSMTDAVGNQLGTNAGKSGPAAPDTIVLGPNDRARLSVHITTESNTAGVICTNGIAQLKVALPNNGSPLLIPSKTSLWCPGFSSSNVTKA